MNKDNKNTIIILSVIIIILLLIIVYFIMSNAPPKKVYFDESSNAVLMGYQGCLDSCPGICSQKGYDGFSGGVFSTVSVCNCTCYRLVK